MSPEKFSSSCSVCGYPQEAGHAKDCASQRPAVAEIMLDVPQEEASEQTAGVSFDAVPEEKAPASQEQRASKGTLRERIRELPPMDPNDPDMIVPREVLMLYAAEKGSPYDDRQIDIMLGSEDVFSWKSVIQLMPSVDSRARYAHSQIPIESRSKTTFDELQRKEIVQMFERQLKKWK